VLNSTTHAFAGIHSRTIYNWPIFPHRRFCDMSFQHFVDIIIVFVRYLRIFICHMAENNNTKQKIKKNLQCTAMTNNGSMNMSVIPGGSKILSQTKCNFSTTEWDFIPTLSHLYGKDPATITNFLKTNYFSFLQSYCYWNIWFSTEVITVASLLVKTKAQF